MRNPPSLRYNGITIIQSHAGRFDKPDKLINGPAGTLLAESCKTVAPKYAINRYQFDIRTMDCNDPLIPDTKVVLLCGEETMSILGQAPAKLFRLRGCPIERQGLLYIPTFHPQDATDLRDYERTLNAQKLEVDGPGVEEGSSRNEDDDDDRDEGEVKEYGRTSRQHYPFWFSHDIRKAIRISKEGIVRYAFSPECVSIPRAIQLLTTQSVGSDLVIDIETDPTDCRLLCIGFSFNGSEVYSVAVQPKTHDFVQNNVHIFLLFQALANAFSTARRIILHNALFDLFILAHFYKIPPPAQSKIYDTMISHHRIWGNVEKSLGHCISLNTDLPYHKDEGQFFISNSTQLRTLMEYNCKDVYATGLVAKEQDKETDEGLRASIALGNGIIRPLLVKTLRGMRLNTTELCAAIDNLRHTGEWIEENILERLVGHKLNPRSPKQVANYLYEELGLPVPRGDVSPTGKNTLYKLVSRYPLPEIKTLLYCRKLSKDAGQISFKLWRNDRVTCSFDPCAKTFRLRSRKVLSNWGTNLQNWPKRLRQLVVPLVPGNVFLQRDQDGAEALIVAYLCPHGRYRELFINRIKVHSYVAMHLFKRVWDELMGEDITRFLDCPIPKLKEQPRWKDLETFIKKSDDNPAPRRYYYFAKQTGHSANYDIQTQTFINNTLDKSDGTVYLPFAEADRFLSVYRTELFPEIPNGFHTYVKSCVREQRLLRNMFGFTRRVTEFRVDDYKIKDFYSWISQSTVGCITNLADTEIQERLDTGEYSGFSVVTNTHDSLMFETPMELLLEVARISQLHMEREMTNPWGERFKMRSEAKYGPDWYHTDKEIAA